MAIKAAEQKLVQQDIAPATPAPGAATARYKLRGAYWDGRREHLIDSIMEFEIGKQPKTAALVPGDEPVAEPVPASVQDEPDDE